MSADTLGWIGNAFFAIGMLAVAKKKAWGFLWNTAGNLLYLVQGLMIGMNSLIAVSVLLASINMYGFFDWKKK